MNRAFAPVEETLQALGEAELLVGRDGDSAAIGIHDHAGVRDALRRQLSLVVAEAQAEVVGEAVPAQLGAAGSAGRASADRAAAGEAGARAVGRGLGGENGVVDPDRGVKGRVVETTADRRGRW